MKRWGSIHDGFPIVVAVIIFWIVAILYGILVWKKYAALP